MKYVAAQHCRVGSIVMSHAAKSEKHRFVFHGRSKDEAGFFAVADGSGNTVSCYAGSGILIFKKF